MSVRIVGRKGEGWRVVIRGYGWQTGSDLLSKKQAIALAARLLHDGAYRKAITQ